MINVIKYKNHLDNKKLQTYVSLIGFAPMMFYQLLCQPNKFKTIFDLTKFYNINKVEQNYYLSLLQAVKLLQSVVVKQQVIHQLFSPLLLIGSNQQKKLTINYFQPKVIKGVNISKTLSDVFNFHLVKSNDKQLAINYQKPWIEFYEEIFNTKLDSTRLLEINNFQNNFKLNDEVINVALKKTFDKCQKYHYQYLLKVVKTFKKLNFQNWQMAQKFFNGELFLNSELNSKYLAKLEEKLDNK